MGRTPYITRREFMEGSALAAAAALIPRTTHGANVIPVNAKRARLSLDGIWRFTPAVSREGSPPKMGWGYIKVPGSWSSHRNRSSGLVARGGGPQWEHYDGGRLASAWYERQVSIPLEWQGRVVSLRFDRVCTDAIVYVNGTECGRVPWPWGSVDITRAVTAGKAADIRVLVAAIADSGMVGHFWQNAFMAVTYTPATLATRGLTGSVCLEGRSSEAHVSDVFVRTSTRKKEIALDVELAGVKRAGRVHFVADMLNEKGAVEKSFTADPAVEAKSMQTITTFWPWAQPRLWDVDQPNLYTLRLTATGAGLNDQYNQEFGFREFWIEGRQFHLNGTVVRLRQPNFNNGPLGSVGDNFSEFGSWAPDARGNDSDAGPHLDRADHKGYLAAVYILDANKYMRDRSGNLVWKQNQKRALERAAVWMRHYRNRPSVVMWIAGRNFFNNAVDMDPRHVGRRGWGLSDKRWRQLVVKAKEMFTGLRQLDPTRAYYSHEGAYTGDVHSMNCYLDLLPLQERHDWLSAWAKDGEMPITMTEFGTPMGCTFRRGHDGFGSNIHSEPLLTEYVAIYFGSGAYTSEGSEYRQWLRNQFLGGMDYKSSQDELGQFPDMHKIQDLFRRSTWECWRTAELPGGLKTWSHLQDELKEINSPTLAWIAGQPGAYTAKDHHFQSGQKFQKQIVLVNDTRQPQHFADALTARVGGEQVSKDELHGTLAISEIRKIPIEIAVPQVKADHKVDGQITLSATIGDATHFDTFDFRVFGKGKPVNGSIAMVDPEGLTDKMLKNLGYTTRPWHGAASPLLAIGRNGLKDAPSVATKLEPYVRDGGRVLIFSQDPDWMTKALGWRICPKVSRYVFPVPNSPVTRGIDADDLRDWSGSSTLIEAYPKYAGNYLRGNEGGQPYAGWRWGNRGGVSSAAVEKPHRSGWTPLLECEFDLAYTPLMQLDYKNGRVMVCTLDLEDHVALDPVARLMAVHVVDHALHAPLAPRASRVVYLGGAAGAGWLGKIGVSYQRSDTLDMSAGLLLAGPDASLDTAALDVYLEKGGKVFFLPSAQADGPLGATLKLAADHFAGSLSVPDWPEARGLSASDLRWRTHLESPPLILSGGAEIGADGLLGRKAIGKGAAIFCQVDPDRFGTDQKTYFRYTRWRSTRAVSQILANLGASFQVDGQIFHPRKPAINLDRIWIGPDGDRAGHDCTPPMSSRLLDMSPTAMPDGTELGYYYPDYRTDFPMGDNPYRYYRW